MLAFFARQEVARLACILMGKLQPYRVVPFLDTLFHGLYS
jgi:hypothetical protein